MMKIARIPITTSLRYRQRKMVRLLRLRMIGVEQLRTEQAMNMSSFIVSAPIKHPRRSLK